MASDGGWQIQNSELMIRDEFAIAALQGMISGRFTPPPIEGIEVQDAVAIAAYLYADAMLKERAAAPSADQGRTE